MIFFSWHLSTRTNQLIWFLTIKQGRLIHISPFIYTLKLQTSMTFYITRLNGGLCSNRFPYRENTSNSWYTIQCMCRDTHNRTVVNTRLTLIKHTRRLCGQLSERVLSTYDRRNRLSIIRTGELNITEFE